MVVIRLPTPISSGSTGPEHETLRGPDISFQVAGPRIGPPGLKSIPMWCFVAELPDFGRPRILNVGFKQKRLTRALGSGARVKMHTEEAPRLPRQGKTVYGLPEPPARAQAGKRSGAPIASILT